VVKLLLYIFAAQLIQFKVMQRRLIRVNIHEDVISLYTQILPHLLENVCLRHIFMLWQQNFALCRRKEETNK